MSFITRYIDDELGALLREKAGVVAVSATPAQVLPANGDRTNLIFINCGSYPINLSPDSSTLPNGGIVLREGGGFAVMSVRGDFLLPVLQWFAAAPAGDSNLYYLYLENRKEGML